MNEIKEYTNEIFEGIKHIDDNNHEYWLARELMKVLEYTLRQNFHKIIKIAMASWNNSNNSNNEVSYHFIDVNKMIKLAKNARRKIKGYKLSRYACYLIVLNCDPRKKIIALAKTYFAIQTRRQELSEKEYNELTEDGKDYIEEIKQENAIKFLKEKLDILGFNNREANEFIMNWLPTSESNEKSLVYFELTEEREKYNKINIKPTPDSLLRVAIHVKKVDKEVNIKEQELPTFKRVGFTTVEWGGVVH